MSVVSRSCIRQAELSTPYHAAFQFDLLNPLLRWASFSKTIDVSFYRLGAKTKIVLVDDDPSALEALSALFEVNGYQVEQASDGVEALLQLEQDKFDLVLSDIRMPKIDGLSLAG